MSFEYKIIFCICNQKLKRFMVLMRFVNLFLMNFGNLYFLRDEKGIKKTFFKTMASSDFKCG